MSDVELDYDSEEDEEMTSQAESEPAISDDIYEPQMKMKYVGHRNAR